MRTRHFVLLLDVMRCLELAASTAERWAAGLPLNGSFTFQFTQ